MDKQTKTKIKNLALSLRDDLEKEIENRLDNIGIYVDKEWKDGRSLTHLSKDEIEKRKRVAAFIKREEKIGLDQKKATSEFIKEASYTWINRVLGLKCMECRGLIEEVITTRPEYGGRSKRHRDFRDKNPDKAAQPDDALPACLFSVFEEVTEEIKVLFDPKNEYSLVIPRYPTLKKAIEKINTELDYNTYREDEFLGWVYQYFNSREKKRVSEELKTKKKKISGSDIINYTTLYTEKYMVRFLVENSLGAMWMEMYPDSHLCNKWEYFVKDPNNSRREPKSVKEIKFLDPAGGSGHFQLYAFDLFYDMYLEEGIIPKDQIPEFILRYNLHGIDIDLRAIQLSALGLYMKAKSKNPDMKVQHMNLVSADAIMLDSAILDEFLKEFKDDQTAQELIKIIWQGLENVRESGSLLKVEEQIDEVIEHKKMKGAQKSLDERDWKEKGWEQWKHDLLAALKRYYEKAAQTFDINKQMFASEACKGVQLLDMLEQRYDVVATNPPYMGKRIMGKNLSDFLKKDFASVYGDLYAAFIIRCMSFCFPKGKVSMVAQNTFMFVVTYENLRNDILIDFRISKVVHLGTHSFEEISGEKVNSVLFVLSQEENSELRDSNKSIFFKLVQSTNKEVDLKKTIIKDNLKLKYEVNQRDFLLIKGHPFVYWASKKVINIFKNNINLIEIAEPRAGIIPADVDKYLRYFWEVYSNNIGNKWIPYNKGGTLQKLFEGTPFVIDWSIEAKEFYNQCSSARMRDPKYHFREGISCSLISGNNFTVKLLEDTCLFDVNAPSIFTDEVPNEFLLGLLSTKLISFLINILNPTLSSTVGDISRIPIKIPDKKIEKGIINYTKNSISIKKSLLQFDINDREFKQTAIQWGYDKKKGDN